MEIVYLIPVRVLYTGMCFVCMPIIKRVTDFVIISQDVNPRVTQPENVSNLDSSFEN